MSKKFKIIFLMPPQKKNGDFRDLRDDVLDNQGLKSIISTLNENNYEVKYINADLLNMTVDQVMDILMYIGEIDLLGISVVEFNAEIVGKLLDKMKLCNYKTKIVAGGFFPTLCYEEFMEKYKMIDYCIIGEGEFSMLDLVTRLENSQPVNDVPGLVYRKGNDIVVNPQTALDTNKLTLIKDLYLPYLIERGGSEYIFTSRGCNSNCSFCSIKAFFKYIPQNPWRELDIKMIVDKIEYLYTKWKQRIIPIWDDNFISGKRGKERAYEFIKEIRKRNIQVKFFMNCRVDDVDETLFKELKSIGLFQVGLGIENIVQSELRFYGKGTTPERIKQTLDILYKLDLETYMSLIIYNPFTNMDYIRSNLDFLQERLTKEKGSTYKNLLLPSISVLGLTRGSRLLEDERIKKIRYKEGFHFFYEMQDEKAEKLKRIMLFLSTQWWEIYIELIRLDHYVFHPFYDYFTQMKDADLIEKYNLFWKRLAVVHLETYRKIFAVLENDDSEMREIIEEYVYELNHLIDGISHFEIENNLKKVFPKIQYFTFKKEDNYVLYDITKSSFMNIKYIHKEILEKYNYMTKADIKDELMKTYSEGEIDDGFAFIENLVKEGYLVYTTEIMKKINAKKIVRMSELIKNGYGKL